MGEKRALLTKRLLVVYLLLLFGWAVPILISIVKIQFVEGAIWREKAEARTLALREVKAIRGNIFSSDGKTLATSVPIFDVYLDLGKETIEDKESGKPKKVYVIPDSVFRTNVKRLADSLVSLFPRSDASHIEKQLISARKDKNRYILLRKDVSLTQLERMKSFPILKEPIIKKKRRVDKDSSLKENVKQEKKKEIFFRRGVIVNRKDLRVNPYNPVARRTIGALDKTGGCDTCFNGLDGYYNKILKGKKGSRMERRLGRNVWVPVDGKDFESAEDGKDIVSSLDVSLQELAEKSLRNCLNTNEADKGFVILMEVQTGYIRAISSLYRVGDSSNQYYIEYTNGACTELYEPGSTYKTVTMMALLENKICDTSMMVPTGVKGFGKTTIHDVDDKDHGLVSLKRAFEISSNVGICTAVWKGYSGRREDFRNDIQRILPYKKLGLDLVVPEPDPTMLQDFKPDRNFLNVAYGYASNITPLQLLTFYNAIANEGKMMKPLFCSSILESGKLVEEIEPVVMNEKICSDRTLSKLRDLLRSVVENGTARRLSNTPYGIAGKTGTTQLGYQNKNEKMTYCASFVGYFPAEKPRYSCIVVVTNPRKNRTHGGELAAPVFKDLADRVCGTKLDIEFSPSDKGKGELPRFSIANRKEVTCAMQQLQIPYKLRDTSSQWVKYEGGGEQELFLSKYTSSVIPDLKGMTIKDAAYLLEKKGLIVSFEGRGKVRAQSLVAGTSFKKGAVIHLVLE